MTRMERLIYEINEVLETSHICRGEWCESLEPKVDKLEYRLSSVCFAEGTCSSNKVIDLEDKIRKTYKQLPADIHI